MYTKKGTKAERETLVCSETRLLDPELQRPHLALLLIRRNDYKEVKKKFQSDVGEIDQKMKVKAGKK